MPVALQMLIDRLNKSDYSSGPDLAKFVIPIPKSSPR
jgi:hypothetical protein